MIPFPGNAFYPAIEAHSLHLKQSIEDLLQLDKLFDQPRLRVDSPYAVFGDVWVYSSLYPRHYVLLYVVSYHLKKHIQPIKKRETQTDNEPQKGESDT